MNLFGSIVFSIMMIMMVIIKRLSSRSQSFVIIWEANLLKVAVQSFLSSLSFVEASFI